MKRLATGIAGGVLVLFAIFGLNEPLFLGVLLVVLLVAQSEFHALARHWVPEAPIAVLYGVVPVATVALYWAGFSGEELRAGMDAATLVLLVLLVPLLLSVVVLVARTPAEQGLPAIGILAFGAAYFVVPVLSLVRVHAVDRWLLLLLVLVVFIGDTAAYYAGSTLGRRRMAPRVSPNKTWEGAIAGLLASVLACAVWSQWRLGRLDPEVVVLAIACALAAQIGDLVESLLKRGAGVKDSGHLLPGHGGMLDRLDALLFAAPVFALGVHFLGVG